MSRLIGLTGKAGTGKDTIAAALVERHGYVRVAFADALKLAAYESNPYVSIMSASTNGRPLAVERLADIVDTHGWDEAKTYPDVRRYLQRYGCAMREQLPGCWIDVLVDRILDLHEKGAPPVVVTDVRFADEVQAVKGLGGLVVRIDRRSAAPLGVNAGHVSEQVEALPVDAVIDNNGTAATIPALADLLHAASVPL